MENENLSVKNDISLDENLEDSKKYKLNCNKEKELFLNIIITVIFGFVGFSFVYYFQQNEIKNKENLIKAFSENKELICSSKVVSICQRSTKTSIISEYCISKSVVNITAGGFLPVGSLTSTQLIGTGRIP